MKIAELYELYQNTYQVSTDTRKITKGCLFFALKGANFNGNTFAKEALEKGAAYAIVDETVASPNSQILQVANVLDTLQKLANYHRRQLQIPIIALTGSNGKTTTKELIHAVLSKKYNTQATKGNLNNHIGVPLSLLSVRPEHEIAVIEMGANHQKEIAFLSSICEPDYGYITNFGKAHLEGFGGVEGVIKGKSELYDYLRANHKTAFVNTNDALQVAKTKDFATIPLDMENILLTNTKPTLEISYHGKACTTQLVGAYNFANMVAAMTIGAFFKVPEVQIQQAVKNYVSENNRSQQITKENYQITLDAYNANPSSMQVALESFAASTNDTKTVVLGDMFELGESAATEHQNSTDLASQLPIDHIYVIGENFYKVVSEKAQQFASYADFKAHVQKHPIPKGAVLIKGSRGMQLERVLELL